MKPQALLISSVRVALSISLSMVCLFAPRLAQAGGGGAASCESLFFGQDMRGLGESVDDFRRVRVSRLHESLRGKEDANSILDGWFSHSRISDLGHLLRFSEVASLAFTIRELFPPEKYVVVSLGRSAFEAADFLNLVTPGSARTMPISYNKLHFWLGNMREARPGYTTSGNETERRLFFELQDRFLPTEAELAGRKLVFLDLAAFGSTLGKYSVDLSAYFAARGRLADYAILGVGSEINPHFLEMVRSKHFESEFKTVPPITYIALGGQLKWYGEKIVESTAKYFAPFPHYIPEPSLTGALVIPSERAKHRLFVNTLKKEFDGVYETLPQFRSYIDGLRAQSTVGAKNPSEN